MLPVPQEQTQPGFQSPHFHKGGRKFLASESWHTSPAWPHHLLPKSQPGSFNKHHFVVPRIDWVPSIYRILSSFLSRWDQKRPKCSSLSLRPQEPFCLSCQRKGALQIRDKCGIDQGMSQEQKRNARNTERKIMGQTNRKKGLGQTIDSLLYFKQLFSRKSLFIGTEE